jgi:uncharacterized protein
MDAAETAQRLAYIAPTGETLIGLAVLVAAFVQGSTGLGFALISGPVIGMIQPRLLPVFLLIQMIPLNG